jgi:NAD(P)-dependent dehydrogenase (short-subunit alcohol dehydrogenase family)
LRPEPIPQDKNPPHFPAEGSSVKGFPFSNGVAVITRAGKGIGAALAHGLAARQCDLGLIDRDADAPSRVVASARQTGVTVSSRQLDIADADALLPQEVLAQPADAEPTRSPGRR